MGIQCFLPAKKERSSSPTPHTPNKYTAESELDPEEEMAKRYEAYEDQLRMKDERIERLQQTSEKLLIDFTEKLKKTVDGQKDLKWQNDAMTDLLKDKEEIMKEWEARIKQIEWEHSAMVEALRDPRTENEKWSPWTNEMPDYYGGINNSDKN